MICKYCGAQYTGNKCTSCGKVIPLVKRSTDLDVLMIGSTDRIDRPNSPGKTYDQGLREGYQKGLKEGYNNGYSEGKEKATLVERPPKTNVKKLIILFASIAVLLSALSGFLFSKIGYKQGIVKGREEGVQAATEDMKPQLAEQYQAGLEQGKSIGFEQGKQEGYETAKREQEKANDKLTAQNEETITEQPTEPVLDLPYSLTKNHDIFDPVVEKIQGRLRELLGNKIEKDDFKVDGFYGPVTEKAVQIFQKRTGINVTGIVDEETYSRLFPEESKTEVDQPEVQMDYEIQPEPDQQKDIDQVSLSDSEDISVSLFRQILNRVLPTYLPNITTIEPEAERTQAPGMYEPKPETLPEPSEEESDWVQS